MFFLFACSYQLPEGLPGSFYVREKLEKLEDGTVFEDKDKLGDSFYDSDDEDAAGPSGSHHGHGHGYSRSALLAVVMYKLKVTLDVNGSGNNARAQDTGETASCSECCAGTNGE